jgi:hypothetical protein
MATLIGDVALTNKRGVFLGEVNLANLNTDANAVLYSTDGTDIKGDSTILKFEQDIKKLTVSEAMSYTSAYPIGVETANNENTYFTGVLAQQKNASDGASAHLLITNDLGTDSSFYGGLDMFSSNSTVQYGQFGSMKNALGLSSQSSSIVLTPNAGNSENQDENSNIFLTFNGGQKAHIIDNSGRLVVNANNPSFSGDTYGGDDGAVNKCLTSDGVQGLKWIPQGGYSSLFNTFFENKQYKTTTSGSSLVLFQKVGLNLIPDSGTHLLIKTIFAFETDISDTIFFDLDLLTDGGTYVSTVQTLSTQANNGLHTIPMNFNYVNNSGVINFRVNVRMSAGQISINPLQFYSIEVNQIQTLYPF